MKKLLYSLLTLTTILGLASCSDDNTGTPPGPDSETPAEYYAGGKLGTTFNNTSSAYEQFTAAVEEQGLVASFKRGERIFESPFDINNDPTPTPLVTAICWC